MRESLPSIPDGVIMRIEQFKREIDETIDLAKVAGCVNLVNAKGQLIAILTAPPEDE